MAQSVGPEFKPQYCQKKKRQRKYYYYAEITDIVIILS
jgi:hypothetical protein